VDALIAHRAALVSARRCPACAEPLRGRALFGAAPCTHCGTRIAEYGLDASRATATLQRRGRMTTVIAAASAGLAQLVVGLIPLADVLVALGVAAWLRLAILGPATAIMSPKRRVVTRGTARMMVAALLAFALVLSTVLTIFGPLGLVAKVLLAAMQVFVGTSAITRYTQMQLGRESAGRPVAAVEIVLLAAVLLLLVLTVGGLALAALWAVETLGTWLGGTS
jgi:hypothetical protein